MGVVAVGGSIVNRAAPVVLEAVLGRQQHQVAQQEAPRHREGKEIMVVQEELLLKLVVEVVVVSAD
jgi:hypothetical protein